ncbi:MAG TPA: hypothetical protein PKE31_14060 [Pseudomonadota bacterium]|nr:hypothetical protein [Pseudomonadota bacterium]
MNRRFCLLARQARRCAAGLVGSVLLLGCAHAPLPDLDERDQQLALVAGRIEAMGKVMQADRAVLYELIAETMCPNPRVRAFLNSCPSLGEEGCHLQDLSSVLGDMASLDHVVVYYFPGQDPRHPDDERKAIIKNLVRRHVRRPTTRLLVAAMPAYVPSKMPAHTIVPLVEQAARSLRQVVGEYYAAERRLAHPNEAPLRMLPATGLSCNHPGQILRPYLRQKDDQPFVNEPRVGQPQIVAWAFLVDC